MITGYQYELWNGKKVVGHCWSPWVLSGRVLTVFENSIFKQRYGLAEKMFIVPIIARTVSDDGVTVVLRRVLDVRRKSKRQIKIILGKQNETRS